MVCRIRRHQPLELSARLRGERKSCRWPTDRDTPIIATFAVHTFVGPTQLQSAITATSISSVQLIAPGAAGVPSPVPPPAGPVVLEPHIAPSSTLLPRPPVRNDLCVVAVDSNPCHFISDRWLLRPHSTSSSSAAAFCNGADKSQAHSSSDSYLRCYSFRIVLVKVPLSVNTIYFSYTL
ncbi:hypothetical protein EDB83DRAFT_2412705 [Lactarius deliciosus]|nr:hypothetical protein EDB83DRAFT_2412705 [Lactarius deliciosus]